MTAPKIRVFISYGRRDASAFVDKLVTDLECEDIAVWRDTANMKTPRPWDEQIPEAIKQSDIVVAVLTPHAVRVGRHDKASPKGDGGESVCLDELAYARFNAPPTPIIPVMLFSCEAPFVIYRLNYLDFTQARDEKGYRQAFSKLVATIRAVKQGEPMGYRTTKFEPIDFDLYLGAKTRDFVGRRWLVDELFGRLARSVDSGAILLIGEPGWGKTAFSGYLFAANPEGRLLAAHFCRADRADTIDVQRFVVSLVAMSVVRIPALAPRVEAAMDRGKELLRAGSAKEALEKLFLEPLAALDPATLGTLPRYVLVDGLDEAAMASGAPTIDTLLAEALDMFPPWLRLVATSRPKSTVLNRFGQVEVLQLDHSDARNLDDVSQLISGLLGERGGPIVNLIEAKADGNALCARQLALAVRNAGMDEREIEKLPRGLSSLYHAVLQRRFDPASSAWRATREIFELMLATDALVPVGLIAQARDDRAQYETRTALEGVADLLMLHDDQVRPFHQTLVEFLSVRATPFFVNGCEGARRLVALVSDAKRFDALAPAIRAFGAQNFAHWCLRLSDPAMLPESFGEVFDRLVFSVQAPLATYRVDGVQVAPDDARLIRHLAGLGAGERGVDVIARALKRALERFQQSGIDPWLRDGSTPPPDEASKARMTRELDMGLRTTAFALGWGKMLGETAPALRPSLHKILLAERGLHWIIGWLDVGVGVHTLNISGYFEDQAFAVRTDWDEIEKGLA